MGAYLPRLLMADETYRFFDFLSHDALRIYECKELVWTSPLVEVRGGEIARYT
jgi:hypothetical protein